MPGDDADRERSAPPQSQLAHSRKTEEIGFLAGGVAHDFNNILAVILGQAGLLLNEPLSARQRKRVEIIHEAGVRGAALTPQLLAFTRREAIEPRVLDLNALIREFTTMLRRLIREDIELVTRLSPGVALIRADPGQIEQVIIFHLRRLECAVPPFQRPSGRSRGLAVRPGKGGKRRSLRQAERSSGLFLPWSGTKSSVDEAPDGLIRSLTLRA